MAAKPLIIEPQYLLLEPNQYKLSKSSVDYLLRTNSPRVQLVPKNGKSDVWQRFSTIRVDGNEVDFCACHQCGGVVTFTKKSGTNGMRTHRCKERRNETLSNNLALTVTPSNYQNRNLIVMPTSSGIRLGSGDNKSQWPATVTKSDKKNNGLTSIVNSTILSWNTPTSIRETSRKKRKTSKIRNDENGFEVDVDCAFYKPNELKVKTVGDDLVICGEHDERKDELGYIKRQFTRRIPIPSDIEPEKLTSSFRSNGVLTIKAPKKCLNDPKERIIPITWNVANAEESDESSDSESVHNEGSVIIDEDLAENNDHVNVNGEELSNEESVLP
ncbi:small heat shock protein p26-like protein [Leptotrombidium deliense]|uniref:Small heat shock protein p26-like protein n=1 Tax=Leptotrombidium deliense TaxID=299467 RepID=A0A443S8F8_9ACAR|nr:small heat shock protein p26-like protein [Leptotrombidium deliense]